MLILLIECYHRNFNLNYFVTEKIRIILCVKFWVLIAQHIDRWGYLYFWRLCHLCLQGRIFVALVCFSFHWWLLTCVKMVQAAFYPNITVRNIGGPIFVMWFNCLEPVGAKAPSFSSSNVRGSWVVRSSGEGFALLCQAQSFPVPTFR